MFSNLRRLFVAHKIKKLIKCATIIIYTEQSDLINYLERDLVAGKKPFDLLCAYIAIRIAAEARTPLEKADIDNTLKELYSSKLSFQNHEEYEAVVDFLKTKAKQSLLIAEIEFLIGKTAYDANNYSYEGIMYSAAKANKGPLSFEERKKFKTLATEFMEAEVKLAEHDKKNQTLPYDQSGR